MTPVQKRTQKLSRLLKHRLVEAGVCSEVAANAAAGVARFKHEHVFPNPMQETAIQFCGDLLTQVLTEIDAIAA